MWPCLDSTVTFLSSISFGTDRTCDTAFSLHSFRTSRCLRPSLPRTSLFSLVHLDHHGRVPKWIPEVHLHQEYHYYPVAHHCSKELTAERVQWKLFLGFDIFYCDLSLSLFFSPPSFFFKVRFFPILSPFFRIKF